MSFQCLVLSSLPVKRPRSKWITEAKLLTLGKCSSRPESKSIGYMTGDSLKGIYLAI